MSQQTSLYPLLLAGLRQEGAKSSMCVNSKDEHQSQKWSMTQPSLLGTQSSFLHKCGQILSTSPVAPLGSNEPNALQKQSSPHSEYRKLLLTLTELMVFCTLGGSTAFTYKISPLSDVAFPKVDPIFWPYHHGSADNSNHHGSLAVPVYTLTTHFKKSHSIHRRQNGK